MPPQFLRLLAAIAACGSLPRLAAATEAAHARPCVDHDDRWQAHNTTCRTMSRLCDDEMYGALVRSWCPRSCGGCNATQEEEALEMQGFNTTTTSTCVATPVSDIWGANCTSRPQSIPSVAFAARGGPSEARNASWQEPRNASAAAPHPAPDAVANDSVPVVTEALSLRGVGDAPLRSAAANFTRVPDIYLDLSPWGLERSNLSVGNFRLQQPADLIIGDPEEDWASAAAALAEWAPPSSGEFLHADDDDALESAEPPSPVFHMAGEHFFPAGCMMREEAMAADLPTNGPYTIEAWVMPDDDIGRGGIVGWGDWGAEGAVQAFRLSGASRLKNSWWGNALVADVGPTLTDGSYHHIAATWDGRMRRIFVDFSEVASQETTGYAAIRRDTFCVGLTGEHEHFRGRIKDLKIWRVSRSAGELRWPTSAAQLRLEPTSTRTELEQDEKRCPRGFELLQGDVYGGDQFSGGYYASADSIEDCARKCAYTPGCGSFEFSPSKKRCFRNSQTRPTHDENRYDFVFCRRAPCPSHKTEESCVGPSVPAAKHTAEVPMRPGSYCIWSGGACQAPMACTDQDCFLPDGGLPGMNLPKRYTLWISRAGLQSTMLPTTHLR